MAVTVAMITFVVTTVLTAVTVAVTVLFVADVTVVVWPLDTV